jgi:hypothetical protein
MDIVNGRFMYVVWTRGGLQVKHISCVDGFRINPQLYLSGAVSVHISKCSHLPSLFVGNVENAMFPL